LITITSIKTPQTTDLYDKFWEFACERQSIAIKRIKGKNPPWTNDEILQKYKFTNAYRFLDRVSQFLISDVIKSESKLTEEDEFFRIILFKLFNKIETWQNLEKEIGPISYTDYDYKKYDKVLTNMLDKGLRIYSAAYIMPSGTSSFGNSRKHRNNLKLLEQIMNDKPIEKIRKMKTLEDLYLFFLNYPTIGNFLAYQYSIDINYSNLCDFSEMDFVVAGPGAIRGINKCFRNVSRKDYSSIIEFVANNQDNEFKKRNLDFHYINNRKLQLIDIQNLFCEIDKYSRQIQIYNTKNQRIKQKYKQNLNPVTCLTPSKWSEGAI
jgi:hypothetical protein